MRFSIKWDSLLQTSKIYDTTENEKPIITGNCFELQDTCDRLNEGDHYLMREYEIPYKGEIIAEIGTHRALIEFNRIQVIQKGWGLPDMWLYSMPISLRDDVLYLFERYNQQNETYLKTLINQSKC